MPHRDEYAHDDEISECAAQETAGTKRKRPTTVVSSREFISLSVFSEAPLLRQESAAV